MIIVVEAIPVQTLSQRSFLLGVDLLRIVEDVVLSVVRICNFWREDGSIVSKNNDKSWGLMLSSTNFCNCAFAG